MKILIVEDDQLLGEVLRDYLQHLDHVKVQLCSSAAQAGKLAAREPFDCAFVDLMLPDSNGLELLQVIKEHQPNTSIIMMSGQPTMEYAIEAMRKGASDFLTKPFDLQDLALTIERVAKERRLLLENLTLHLEQQTRVRVEQLNAELELKIQEQTRLFEISREIDEARSSEVLYPCIVSLAARLTAVGKVGFFVLSGSSDQLLLISEQGFASDPSSNRLFSTHGDFMKRMRGADVNQLALNASDLGGIPWFASPTDENSRVCCWPFRIRGQLFGVLMTCHNGPASGLSASDANVLEFLTKKAALAIENMALYESLVSNFYGILKSLVNALEAKDPYTGKHSERVTAYAVQAARQLDCTPAQIGSLESIGYLHDLGKIGIADSILNKPAGLTAGEYELIKRHPVIGDSIVRELGLSAEERSIIRHHHERWDGRGYPDGLARREIPMLARIVAVADAFDSMTSGRAYRKAMFESWAIQELHDHAGAQFDPEVVEAFVTSRKDQPKS
jgi:response regulator RpfG family c-di-GMP phosphodiesterase